MTSSVSFRPAQRRPSIQREHYQRIPNVCSLTFCYQYKKFNKNERAEMKYNNQLLAL